MTETRIHIFIGAYGSGKTEAAVNFAVRERSAGRRVALVDLDIVNPYFRSRDAAEALAAPGLEVISSSPGMELADLPALSPRITGALRDPGLAVVFDVGGDPAGARALGRFGPLLREAAPEVWLVANPYRPETRTPVAIARLADALSAAGGQRVTGLFANPNLGAETTVETVVAGRRVVDEAAVLLGLPVALTGVRADLAGAAAARLGPILPLRRYMLLPWESG